MSTLDDRGRGPEAKQAVERLRKLAMRATAGPPPFEWLYGVRIDVFVEAATQALHSADDRGHVRSIVMRAPDVLAQIQRDIASNAHLSSVVAKRYRSLAQLLWADRIQLSEVDRTLREIMHADDAHHQGGSVAVTAANETDAQTTWRQSAVNLSVAASAAYGLGYFAIVLFTVYAAASRAPGVSSLPSSVRLGLVSLLALPQGLAGPLVEAGLSRVVPTALAGVASRNLFASFAVASLASAASYVILYRLTQLATDSAVSTSRTLLRRAFARVVGSTIVEDAAQVTETSSGDLATIERAVTAELQTVDIEELVDRRARKLIEARLDVARGDIRSATEKAQMAILNARMRQIGMVEEAVKSRVDKLLGGVIERIEQLDAVAGDLASIVGEETERVEQLASTAALGELVSMAKLGTLERIGDVQQMASIGRNTLATESYNWRARVHRRRSIRSPPSRTIGTLERQKEKSKIQSPRTNEKSTPRRIDRAKVVRVAI